MTTELKTTITTAFEKCISTGNVPKCYNNSTIQEDIDYLKNELANLFSNNYNEYLEIWNFLDTL